MIMTDSSNCKDCGRLLPEGSGFSDLCDKCSPVEELEIVGGTEALREVAAPYRGDNRLALPVRPRRTVHVQPKPKVVEDFDLGISLEMATLADIEEYKKEIENELLLVRTNLDDLKIKKATKIWSDPVYFKNLEKERKILGRKHQILTQALAVKRRAARRLTPEEQKTHHDTFLGAFYSVAKRLLSGEAFQMICKQANIEAGT